MRMRMDGRNSTTRRNRNPNNQVSEIFVCIDCRTIRKRFGNINIIIKLLR